MAVSVLSSEIELASLTELRALTPTAAQIYKLTAAGLEGEWRYDASDTTTADNGGTVLVCTGGGRLKRVYDGPIQASWFGMSPDSADNTAALQAAVNWACAQKNASSTTVGGIVEIDHGLYRLKFLAGTSGLSTITINADGVTIQGQGQGTILIASSSIDVVTNPSHKIDYFFTFKQVGLRGNGGGLRDIRISGNNGRANWACFIDSWRECWFTNVIGNDLHMGVLDFTNDQTTYAEMAHCIGIGYITSSAVNACIAKFGIRFRAGTTGTWSDCDIRETNFVGVWYAHIYLDAVVRFDVRGVRAGGSYVSSNSVDGGTKSGCFFSTVVTATVTNSTTADTGQHIIEGPYLESHASVESFNTYAAVVIDRPTIAGNTTDKIRFNTVRDVSVSFDIPGPSILWVKNSSGVDGLVSANVFEGNRRAVTGAQIQIGTLVRETDLRVRSAGNNLYQILDQGIDTAINGLRTTTVSSAPPAYTRGDVGYQTWASDGRWWGWDRNGSPQLLGARPGLDFLSAYGANRIQALPTPAAPSIIKRGSGATSFTYYIVAKDKDGNKSLPSSGTPVSNCPATLSGSTGNDIRWAPVDGAVKYDILRGDTAHSIATDVIGCYYYDVIAGAGNAYTPAGSNPPAKLTVDGDVVFKSTLLLTSNAGTPEGSVTAPVGSLCSDTTNGKLYIKATGAGNTGWVVVGTQS